MTTWFPWPVVRGLGPLRSGEIRVWRVNLDLVARSIGRAFGQLSEDEIARAARFHFRRDAVRFVLSRAALRTGLAECLDVAPRAVRFRYGSHGKPELAAPFDRARLHFNLSHSDRLGLYAVAATGRVGVDVERLRPLPDFDQIVQRVFSPRERQALRRLTAAEQPTAFFNCWTRKEAYVKGTGAGLSARPDRITVSLAPGAPARLEHVEGDSKAPSRWIVQALAPDPEYVGAIALEGRSARLTCYTLQEVAA